MLHSGTGMNAAVTRRDHASRPADRTLASGDPRRGRRGPGTAWWQASGF